ncbi:MAG: serine/threonine protein kinase [Pirellulales bacterium]|nr:serine/threonine protein kinase [Pirellulales bacterium]
MNPDPRQPDFEALEAYLQRLHAGEAVDRDAFLREHPQLASALKCLDALENLAPPKEDQTALGQKSSTLPEIVSAVDFPRSFGNYELLGELGRGGMGVVYKARQQELERVVALKMILQSHLASPEHVRRFQAEAKAAAKLRHSHIVQIHEVGQLHGQDFFTMEYIEGQSLAQRLNRRPIDFSAAVRIVAAIARAVDYLHKQGVVHRDLKPSNILLDADGDPFLTDFGLAKVFLESDSRRTATGVIAGTPSYMAPEQAAGRTAEIGPAADIYSLGAILYELLAGQPPFAADNPLDVLLDVLSGDPPLPRRINPKIPRALELICLKCLQKSPSDRYRSAAALADDLDRFARGEPLLMRPPSIGQRFWSWTRRQPALASRLIGLGLFWLVDTTHFLLGIGGVTAEFHLYISIVIAVWAAASIACQQFLDRRPWSLPARFAWGTLDSLLLFVVLKFIADGAASPLIVCYFLVIVASGLWFRVRYVWFMAVLSLISYGILIVDFYRWRPELHNPQNDGLDRHIIFVVSLVILAGIVAYMVQRVRILSSFYGQKLP